MKRLLPFLLLLISASTLAESGAYRVEVIVFRNLEVVTQALATEELRSFSRFPELEETSPATNITPDPTEQPLPDDLNAELADIWPDHLPDDLHVLERRSAYMDDVWRRMRSSQGYRPLVYAAWEQNRVDYNPPMRIHNQEVIDTQLRPPSRMLVADLTAEDPLAAYRSAFYQLDGSVQLRRSRFLHLFLDLEIRVQAVPTATEPETSFFSSGVLLADSDSENQNNDTHGIFKLKQNRQIRTNQLQYFDTPYFGVLVLVSAIAP